MSRHQILLVPFSAVPLLVVLSPSPAPAGGNAPAKQSGKIAGILFDKQNDWITVKADGDKEPVKYVVSSASAKKAMKNIYNAGRVQLTYKKDGDTRQVVSIKRQVLRASGSVTGTVVKVHNNFWVEVKPKNGPPDAYAPGANYNDKAFMARLRALRKGESVTIMFTTDFERHRIVALRKN